MNGLGKRTEKSAKKTKKQSVVESNAKTGEPEYIYKEDYKKNDYGMLAGSCCIPIVCKVYKWHGKEYYTPASRGGRAVYLIAILYPYEDWMEEYIGTDKDIRKDERLKNETD